jgi:hypothetical protein
MVFPGVLRGRPGPRLATIHTSQPRRSLSSPWMCTRSSVAAVYTMTPRGSGKPPRTYEDLAKALFAKGPLCERAVSQTTAPHHWPPNHWPLNEVDAVPGRFEEPHAGRPESLPTIGGAASHLGGLALCGSGSASASNVRMSWSDVKRVRAFSPHIPKKSIPVARETFLGGVLRRRLSQLPQ